MKIADAAKIVENLLAHGQTEEAIRLLMSLTDGKSTDLREVVILLASQYREHKRNEMMDLETNAKDLNRINLSLLNFNNQLSTQLGQEDVSPTTISLARQLQEAANQQSAVFNKKTNGFKWVYLAVPLLILLGFYVFKTIFNKKIDENLISSPPSVETPSRGTMSANSTQTAVNTSSAKPIFIDKKAKFRNLELLETRYYPTDGVGVLEFDINYDCPYGSSGGCGVGNNNITLIAGDKEIIPKEVMINKGKSVLFLCNTDGLITLQYDNIPQGVQKVTLKVSENLSPSTEPMRNPMTIDFDLTKTLNTPEKPILINLDSERDFNIQKNYGYIKVRSVKATPYSDKEIAVKMAFTKNLTEDFYECCIRLIADKRRIGGETTYKQQTTEVSEGEISFIVPKTTQNMSIMVGKCNTDSPYMIPLSW